MAPVTRAVRLTAAESFWYLLGCMAFGAMYLAKVPAKKALAEAGLARMTSAERFWYRVQCVAFGAGYLAKLPVKQALSEMGPSRGGGHRPGADQGGQPEDGGLIPAPRREQELPAARRHGRRQSSHQRRH
jgi:hypothetical protein